MTKVKVNEKCKGLQLIIKPNLFKVLLNQTKNWKPCFGIDINFLFDSNLSGCCQQIYIGIYDLKNKKKLCVIAFHRWYV